MYEAIQALHNRYIRALDDGNLEAWPYLFTEDGIYRVITRENFDANQPLAVMECHGRAAMQDSVTGFRQIPLPEPQRYLHQTSGLVVESVGEFYARCRSNYIVIRTLGDGSPSIFSAGQYHDEVFIRQNRPQFRQRVVIPDSRRVDTPLVIPL